MKITDEHLYHGAALTQIAEHKAFTAINAVRKTSGALHRSAFKINEDIGIYFKYASAPRTPHAEYPFIFLKSHLEDLARLSKKLPKLFVAFICIRDAEICCISYQLLCSLIEERRHEAGPEETATVLVHASKGKKFRVYMNAPRTKGRSLTQHLVARNAFPEEIFRNI